MRIGICKYNLSLGRALIYQFRNQWTSANTSYQPSYIREETLMDRAKGSSHRIKINGANVIDAIFARKSRLIAQMPIMCQPTTQSSEFSQLLSLSMFE